MDLQIVINDKALVRGMTMRQAKSIVLNSVKLELTDVDRFDHQLILNYKKVSNHGENYSRKIEQTNKPSRVLPRKIRIHAQLGSRANG